MLRIFETIKKSPFLNGNFLLSSLPANASAEIWKFKMKEEREEMKEEKGIILNFEFKKSADFFRSAPLYFPAKKLYYCLIHDISSLSEGFLPCIKIPTR